MAFLPKSWLARLWHVRAPSERIELPIDCEACREARADGRDACAAHHDHPLPHRYLVGDEIHYGTGLDTAGARDSDELP